MKVADAVVDYLANTAPINTALGGLPAQAQPHADKVGSLFGAAISRNIGGGMMAGGAAVTAAGAGLLKLSEPLERANAILRQAVENTGKSWDAYAGKVDAAAQHEEKYGHTQADTRKALTNLTVAYQDPQKALDKLQLASDLAAKKGIDLASAADIIAKAHMGSSKALKDMGVNLKDQTKLVNDAAKADTTHQKAVDQLTKDQKALSDLEARDAGVKKLSVSQQQALAAAKLKVADAQSTERSTADAATAAQLAAKDATKNIDAAMDEGAKHIHGFADAQADTFGGKFQAVGTRVKDFAATFGKELGPVMVATGPAMAGVGGIIQSGLVPALARATVGLFTTNAEGKAGLIVWAGQKIAMGAGAVASGLMTAAQWALNVAMDANPIGLVVIAIAALIGGFILAYQHIKPFRDFVQFLWKEVEMLWHWIAGGSPGLVPILQTLAGVIGTVLSVALTPMRLEFEAVTAVVKFLWDKLTGFNDWLVGVFRGTFKTIGDDAKKVGDALNSINPFAKHSPSLVENVDAGTAQIQARYSKLAVSVKDSMTGILPRPGAGAGGAVHNHFNFPVGMDPRQGRRLGRDIAWEMK